MTSEQRVAAWQRCEAIRRQLDDLAQDAAPEASAQSAILLRELDCLEDALAMDLLGGESGAEPALTSPR